MQTSRKIMSFVALSLLLSACSKEGSEDGKAPGAPTTAQEAPAAPPPPALPAEPGPDALLPTTVAANAVSVGTTLQGDTVAMAATPQFTMADTVHAGAAVKGKPGAEVAVYWTYEDGRTHKEERRPLAEGEKYVRFSFAAKDGMKPGKYNAQIDINMVPIGITDFVVK